MAEPTVAMHYIGLFPPNDPTQSGNGAWVGRRGMKRAGRVRIKTSETLAPAPYADYSHPVDDLFLWKVARLDRDDNNGVAKSHEFLGQRGNIAFHAANVRMV